VVVIVGEPGIGKSRLLRQFRQRLGTRATWIEGQALAFGQAMPFHPVIDMLRRAYRIDDGDAEPVVVEKIEQALGRLGGAAAPALPFIRYLLSVDPGDPAVRAMDPKQRHAEIVRASQLLLARGAELRPHVVVAEDVHWADVATEDWLTRLANGVVARRVLFLLTCRPGYRPPFGGHSFHTGLALAALSGDDTRGMVESLLDADEVPPALGALVVDKAEGNPFFVEELVLALQEQGHVRREGGRVVLSPGLDGVAVPDTVEEVILARMRRLDDHLRRVIEVASVIGRQVPFTLLRALTGRPEEALGADLRRLGEAEFLYEVRAFPEVEHTFKHALTQDVAYASLPADARRTLHARTVRAIEELFPGRLEEHAERLAHHALRGEEWERAVRYGRLAFAKAFDRSANREAVHSLEQALAALQRLPESPDMIATGIDVRLALRSALLQLGQFRRMTERLREAEALATGAGLRTRLGWVWTYLTISYMFLGDLPQALDVGGRALAVAEEVGDFGLLATARTPLAHVRRERGDLRVAVALLEETIAALAGDRIRERLGQGMPPALYARNIAAVCLADLGEPAEAGRLAGEAERFAETLDLPFGLALARIALGHTRLTEGRLDEADQVLGLALQLIEARGMPTWFPWAAATRARVLTLAGRAAEAVPLLEQAVSRAVALPFLCGHSQWTAWLAHAQLLAGRRDEAARLGAEAVHLSRQRGERGYEAAALAILAEIEAGGGTLGDAETLYREALSLAGALGMRPLARDVETKLEEIGRRRVG
jgi:tetratricopeptide (TPR) repeat protein